MKVGIISDTHDNMNKIRRAADIFKAEGISLLIHAGDFVAPFTIPVYRGIGCEFVGVFGNNDGDKCLLNKRAEGKIHSAPHVFDFGGKKFVVTHYPDAVDLLAASGGADVVIYGHTHDPEIKRAGKTIVINPGEGGGWSSGKATAVILDTDTMEARLVSLD